MYSQFQCIPCGKYLMVDLSILVMNTILFNEKKPMCIIEQGVGHRNKAYTIRFIPFFAYTYTHKRKIDVTYDCLLSLSLITRKNMQYG